MRALVASLLIAATPPVEEALRALETEGARAQGKTEESIRAIEKVLKNQRSCPRPQPCPPCPDVPRDVEEIVSLVCESGPSAPKPWPKWLIVASGIIGLCFGFVLGQVAGGT